MEDCAAVTASGLRQGRGRRPCENGCSGEVSAGWLLCVPAAAAAAALATPRADGLLIKQKLDTGSNYCIAPRRGVIQGPLLSVCFEGSPTAEGGSKDVNGQLGIVCSVSRCDDGSGGSGGSGDSIQRLRRVTSQSIVIKGQ